MILPSQSVLFELTYLGAFAAIFACRPFWFPPAMHRDRRPRGCKSRPILLVLPQRRIYNNTRRMLNRISWCLRVMQLQSMTIAWLLQSEQKMWICTSNDGNHSLVQPAMNPSLKSRCLREFWCEHFRWYTFFRYVDEQNCNGDGKATSNYAQNFYSNESKEIQSPGFAA